MSPPPSLYRRRLLMSRRPLYVSHRAGHRGGGGSVMPPPSLLASCLARRERRCQRTLHVTYAARAHAARAYAARACTALLDTLKTFPSFEHACVRPSAFRACARASVSADAHAWPGTSGGRRRLRQAAARTALPVRGEGEKRRLRIVSPVRNTPALPVRGEGVASPVRGEGVDLVEEDHRGRRLWRASIAGDTRRRHQRTRPRNNRKAGQQGRAAMEGSKGGQQGRARRRRL
jgi:hypothetical protein